MTNRNRGTVKSGPASLLNCHSSSPRKIRYPDDTNGADQVLTWASIVRIGVDVRRHQDVLLARQHLEELRRTRAAAGASLGGDGGAGHGLKAGFDERGHVRCLRVSARAAAARQFRRRRDEAAL